MDSRLLHLRLERVHLGHGRLPRRRGALQRVGRGRVLAHEVLLARGLQLGQHELRLLVGELRLLVEQLRPVAVDSRLVDRRVDLGQELSFLDDGADVHEQLLQLPGDLRADIDVVLGLERPGRGDRVLEIPARGRRSKHSSARSGLGKPRLPHVVAADRQQRARNQRQWQRGSSQPPRASTRVRSRNGLDRGFCLRGIRGVTCADGFNILILHAGHSVAIANDPETVAADGGRVVERRQENPLPVQRCPESSRFLEVLFDIAVARLCLAESVLHPALFFHCVIAGENACDLLDLAFHFFHSAFDLIVIHGSFHGFLLVIDCYTSLASNMIPARFGKTMR